MKQRFNGSHYIIRLQKGEELIATLTDFVKQNNILGAWINGLGGSSNAILSFYDLKIKKYQQHNFDEFMEVTNLQGNVAWLNDEPFLHIHGTLADKDAKAFAGHVKKLVVDGTLELMITLAGDKLVRKHDDQTGLDLLQL